MFSILPRATQICELAVNLYIKEQNNGHLIQEISFNYLVFLSTLPVLAISSYYRPMKQRITVYLCV